MDQNQAIATLCRIIQYDHLNPSKEQHWWMIFRSIFPAYKNIYSSIMSPGVVVGENPLKPQSLLEAKSQVRAGQHDPFWFFESVPCERHNENSCISGVPPSEIQRTSASVHRRWHQNLTPCSWIAQISHIPLKKKRIFQLLLAMRNQLVSGLVEGSENSNCYKLPLKKIQKKTKKEKQLRV